MIRRVRPARPARPALPARSSPASHGQCLLPGRHASTCDWTYARMRSLRNWPPIRQKVRPILTIPSCAADLDVAIQLNLDYPDPGRGDVTGQARAVAAGALDADQAHRAETL
jgi:hypothetical protein